MGRELSLSQVAPSKNEFFIWKKKKKQTHCTDMLRCRASINGQNKFSFMTTLRSHKNAVDLQMEEPTANFFCPPASIRICWLKSKY